MQTIIIGLGYKARNGKDSAAAAILRERGDKYDIRRYSFAKALKDEITAATAEAGSAYDLIQKMRLTHNLPSWVQYEVGADMTDPLCPFGKQRTLLQWWGTDYRRKQDPFYWVRKIGEAIAADKPQIAVISDVRFLNEVYWIKANEGYTVKVTRHGFAGIGESHKSEKELDGYKFDIDLTVMDGALSELERDAVAVFDMIIEWNTPPTLETKDFTEESLKEAA